MPFIYLCILSASYAALFDVIVMSFKIADISNAIDGTKHGMVNKWAHYPILNSIGSKWHGMHKRLSKGCCEYNSHFGLVL